jgi:hypothetical protein
MTITLSIATLGTIYSSNCGCSIWRSRCTPGMQLHKAGKGGGGHRKKETGGTVVLSA